MVFLDGFSIANHRFLAAWDFLIFGLLLPFGRQEACSWLFSGIPGPRPALIEGHELIGWAGGQKGIPLETLRKWFFLDGFSIANHRFLAAWDFLIFGLLLPFGRQEACSWLFCGIPGPRPALIEGHELIGWAGGQKGIPLETLRKWFF